MGKRAVWAVGLLLLLGRSGIAGEPTPLEAALTRGDYASALGLLMPLAVAGRPDAEYRLCRLYSSGTGVPQNDALEFAWCRDAAEQGYPPAQYELAQLYATGIGTPLDYSWAYVWANIAVARLPPGAERQAAIHFRDFAENRLTWPQIMAAQQVALLWQPKPPQPPRSVLLSIPPAALP